MNDDIIMQFMKDELTDKELGMMMEYNRFSEVINAGMQSKQSIEIKGFTTRLGMEYAEKIKQITEDFMDDEDEEKYITNVLLSIIELTKAIKNSEYSDEIEEITRQEMRLYGIDYNEYSSITDKFIEKAQDKHFIRKFIETIQ